MSPRVAVLLPTYNRAWCLPETLESLKKQTFRDFVVIAVDDASTDSSYELLANAMRRDPSHWRVFRNPSNRGMVNNWIRCLELQREVAPAAEYLLKLDSDDLLDENLLEVGVKELDADHEAVICHFRTWILGPEERRDAASGAVGLKLASRGWCLSQDHRMPAGTALWLFIRYDNFVASSGALFRCSALQRLPLSTWDDRVVWASDYELWTRLAALGSLRYVADTAVYYRCSPDATTSALSLRKRGAEASCIAVCAFRRNWRQLGLASAAALLPAVLIKWWDAGLNCGGLAEVRDGRPPLCGSDAAG